MITTNFDTLSVFQSGGRIFAADQHFVFSTPYKSSVRSVTTLTKLDPILTDHEEVHIDFQVDEEGFLHERDIFTDVQSSVSFSPHIEWRTLPEHVLEGLEIVRGFTQGQPELFTGFDSGVHLTPNFIEGTDSHQIARYQCDTGFTDSIYLSPVNLRYVNAYELNQFVVTEDWIHFRNSLGTILSLRGQDYECYKGIDLDEFLKVDGPEFRVPEGMAEVCIRLSNMACEENRHKTGVISLSDGQLKLTMQSPYGPCEESFQIDHEGEALTRSVSFPQLSNLAEHSTRCSVMEDRLVGINDRLKVVIGLFDPKEGSGGPSDGGA
jgi:hypothetical protein